MTHATKTKSWMIPLLTALLVFIAITSLLDPALVQANDHDRLPSASCIQMTYTPPSTIFENSQPTFNQNVRKTITPYTSMQAISSVEILLLT
jgi:hypothetical protein